jgi:hypothetical protein
VVQRIGNLLLIVVLLVSTGGHWALLQSVAWTTMLAENMRSETFSAAVKQTFDGQHPCKLCCAICAAKKAEKKAEFPVSLKKIEFPPWAAKLVLYAPTTFQMLKAQDTFAESPTLPPPTPPPRALPV